jgi:hypothetical protein
MRHIGELVRATDQEAQHPNYQAGIKAMWESRWISLGEEGKAHWIERHGSVPMEEEPLVDAAPRLRGVEGLTPGAMRTYLRRSW